MQTVDDSMGRCSCLAKCVSESILIAINCTLAIGGVLVLYFGVYLSDTGWVEVIKGYWAPIDTIITALIIIAGIIIALALLGSIAAVCRWRVGLCVYANVVLVIFILFVAVAGAAFLLRHQATTWEDSNYPASNDEEFVKVNFDQAYCYAQGAFVCNQASVSDALAMFVPTFNLSNVPLFENMTGGINVLCDDYLGDFDMLSSVCDGCNQVRQLKTFSSVLDWANEKCPRTAETWIWCGGFLSTGELNSSYGTAPYVECRTEFLHLVEEYALWLGMCSILVCTDALIVIMFACILRHRDRRSVSLDSHSMYGRF